MAELKEKSSIEPEPDFSEFRRRFQKEIDRLPVNTRGTLKQLLSRELWNDACEVFGATGFGRRVNQLVRAGRISGIEEVRKNESNHMEYITVG